MGHPAAEVVPFQNIACAFCSRRLKPCLSELPEFRNQPVKPYNWFMFCRNSALLRTLSRRLMSSPMASTGESGYSELDGFLLMKNCVLGLDCASPEIIFQDERLVNLRRLMDLGLYGRSANVVPPITVPAWMCMATSQDPGSLGVYGFRNRTDHSYETGFA